MSDPRRSADTPRLVDPATPLFGEPPRGPDGTRGAATVLEATAEPAGMLEPETTNTQRARGRLAEDRSQTL